MNKDYIKLAQRVESMFGSEVDESELRRLAEYKEWRLIRSLPRGADGPGYRDRWCREKLSLPVPLSDNLTGQVLVWSSFWSSPVPEKRRNRLQDAISRVFRSGW